MFISLVAGILTIASIVVTTSNIDQAQTTTSNVNSEQGNGLLKKGALVRYVGKIKASEYSS